MSARLGRGACAQGQLAVPPPLIKPRCRAPHPSIVLAVNVYLPKDRVTSQHQGYGFVEFRGEEDADYVSLPAAANSD